MKYVVLNVMLICLALSLAGCGADKKAGKREKANLDQEKEEAYQEEDVDFTQADKSEDQPYMADTKLSEVISDPSFGDYGRLIFPADSGYYGGDTLGTLKLTWYSNIDPEKTVEIVNYRTPCASELGAWVWRQRKLDDGLRPVLDRNI